MDYKKLSLWLMVCMSVMIVGCDQETTEKEPPVKTEDPAQPQEPTEIIKWKEKTTLQNIVDSSNENDVIDLSSYEGITITNYSAVVNKTLTIKNGSLHDNMLTIEADNVTLEGLNDVKVTTSPKLGDGKLTINDSNLSDLLLNGGGSNSIYVTGESNVTNLTMDYLNVRALLGANVTVNELTVNQDAIVQAQKAEGDNKNATITTMTLAGYSALANVGGGTDNDGGTLQINEINFSGDNSQINLGGNINAEKISANSTSKIITNNNEFGNAKNNIEVKEGNTSLTIVTAERMTPLSLLAWGLSDKYLIGDVIDKSKIIVMEENRLEGKGLVYRHGSAAAESVSDIWIKKNQTEFEITIDGSPNLQFTKSGTAKIVVTVSYKDAAIKDLTFVEDVIVVDPSEVLSDITIDIDNKEPKISLYYAQDGVAYKKLPAILKDPQREYVIMAVASIPEGYNVYSWKINGKPIPQEMEFGSMLKMPLVDVDGDYLSLGENRISLIVSKNDNSGKALSGNVAFDYKYHYEPNPPKVSDSEESDKGGENE